MDRSFGVLLMAGALLALWLYDTGRLPAVWAVINQGPGAKPGMPVSTPPVKPFGSKPSGVPGTNTAAPPSMSSVTPQVAPNQGPYSFFPEGG